MVSFRSTCAMRFAKIENRCKIFTMRFTLFISFALAALISFKVCAGMSERDDAEYDSRYMLRKARNALMSYRSVKKKTKELTLRLQKETVGDNTEFLVFLTPFVTQEF